ncbi:molybdopterin-synthase adenylyltransferase MoeB [bacterium]|nr:molybdopterin-synthase adenylyltransferase MoeB [bacterium]
MSLSEDQLKRYNRHILLKEFGTEGQTKIAEAKVLVIGSGGLGSPTLLYLAAAGIGTIGIADGDQLDVSNLQRQIIHSTPDIGRSKVESAGDRINALNPHVNLNLIPGEIKAHNILSVIKDYDFVIDGTDNFSSKFLINDACVLSGKPFVHSGVLRFHGQIITVVPPSSACYRCIFIEAPTEGTVPSCSRVGVLGTVPGILGTMQATECIKYIIGKGDLLTNRLLVFDAFTMTFNEVKINKNPNCPVCGKNPSITKPED